jgi:putative inorganic carbon (HCO3(-)) transporter
LSITTSAAARIVALVDRWHWLLMVAVAPLLLFPSPGRAWALAVVPGLWIIAWLARREAVPPTPLNVSIFLLVVMVTVSTWATYDLAVSLPKIAGMVLGVGVFYVFVRCGRSLRGWWACLAVFLGCGLGISILGLFGTNWIAKMPFLAPLTSRLAFRLAGLPGAEGGFHPNEVAGALLWVIPVLLALGYLVASRPADWLAALGRRLGIVMIFSLAATAMIILATFLLAQSRGGYLGLGATCILMIGFVLSRRARLFYWVLLSTALAFAIGLACTYGTETVLTGLFGGNSDLDGALSLNTLEGRVEVWSRAIYGLQDFPFTGMGMNTFRTVVHILYPLFQMGPDVDLGHAHNEFLQAALDLGIPGLIAFLAIYLGAFWMLFEAYQSCGCQSGTFDRTIEVPAPWLARLAASFDMVVSPFRSKRTDMAVAVGLGGGLLAHLLYGLTDAVSLGAKPGVLFWMLLGLIVGLYERQDDKEVHSGQPADGRSGASTLGVE